MTMPMIEFADASLARSRRRSPPATTLPAPPARRRPRVHVSDRRPAALARTAKALSGLPWGLDAANDTKTITRLWIVCSPGMAATPHAITPTGDLRAHPRPERIDDRAFDVKALNDHRRGLWDIRCGHRGKPIVCNLGGRLHADTWPGVGLVVEARLDMTSAAQRALAAQCRAVPPSVSVQFRRLEVERRRDARGREFDLVTRGELLHVALLTSENETPAYPQAGAWIMDGPSHEAERQRQRDEVVRRALARATS